MPPRELARFAGGFRAKRRRGEFCLADDTGQGGRMVGWRIGSPMWGRLILAAESGGQMVGTVQLILAPQEISASVAMSPRCWF